MRALTSIGLLIAALSFTACDDDTTAAADAAVAAEPLDEHACEHIIDGPVASVTAAVAYADALEGFEPHHRVDVTLVEMPSGANGGFLQFTATEAGHYRFLLDADTGLMLHTADNMQQAWHEMGAPEGCDAAAMAYEIELEADTPYLLVFGPTEATSVGFVARVLGEDHDHEDEDHDHE